MSFVTPRPSAKAGGKTHSPIIGNCKGPRKQDRTFNARYAAAVARWEADNA